ncbi:MAG: DUF3786 domain-containing protein [Dehalococcoidia bacterium]|jgi:hypothetical protein
MGLKDKKLISLQQIEGAVSPHQKQIDHALRSRKEALEYVTDVSELAGFIGGKVESLGIGEDWAISKEIFPGVRVFYVFNRADDEFASNLKVLFSGDRIKMMRGEDLAGFVILYAIHMLRYVRDSNTDKKLPEICYRV